MTVVEGRIVRSVGFDTFADITDADLVGITRTDLTFDADLTEAQVSAIWERMTSKDDTDQAARALLRASDGASNLAEMVRAYVLGDPMPTPVYPTN